MASLWRQPRTRRRLPRIAFGRFFGTHGPPMQRAVDGRILPARSRCVGFSHRPPEKPPTALKPLASLAPWRENRSVFGSPLHAHHLLKRVHHLDQIRLVRHDLVDVLVGSRDLVEHALVLAADDALGLGGQVGDGEPMLGRGAAQAPASAGAASSGEPRTRARLRRTTAVPRPTQPSLRTGPRLDARPIGYVARAAWSQYEFGP